MPLFVQSYVGRSSPNQRLQLPSLLDVKALLGASQCHWFEHLDLWFKPASAGVSKFLPAGEDPDQDAEEESEEEGAVTFLTIEGKSYVKKAVPNWKNVNVSGQFLYLRSFSLGHTSLMRDGEKDSDIVLGFRNRLEV